MLLREGDNLQIPFFYAKQKGKVRRNGSLRTVAMVVLPDV